MALVVVASGKGSPGATTVALALATVWPRPAVLAELDPAGGDLAYRLRRADGEPLTVATGVASIGAAPDGPLADHLQQVASGLDVLVGPPPTGLAEPVERWDVVADVLGNEAGVDVIADCGRLHPGTPVLDVLRAAAAVVLVTRPVIDGVAHLLALARDLVEAVPGVPVHVVVVADVRDARSRREIAGLVESAELPVAVLGRIAHDRDAIGLLSGGWSARLDRSLLMRSARELAVELADAVPGPPELRRR